MKKLNRASQKRNLQRTISGLVGVVRNFSENYGKFEKIAFLDEASDEVEYEPTHEELAFIMGMNREDYWYDFVENICPDCDQNYNCRKTRWITRTCPQGRFKPPATMLMQGSEDESSEYGDSEFKNRYDDDYFEEDWSILYP